MKQIVQHLRNGSLDLLDVPVPMVAPGHLLIRTRASVISAGTERMLVEFARGNLLAKARQQPQRVRQAIEKVKTDGLLATVDAVRNRLDQPLALGYCNAGEVIAVGEGVDGFKIGDRVASNGPHAEVVHVPKHLCAKVPATLDDERAAFAVLGAISLQGIRLLKPDLGETIAVYGLGLIGLLAVQLLVANGANVIGIDIDATRLELAKSLGTTPFDADDVANLTGVDGVLITASARDDDILHQSAAMSRKRGRIVLIGVVDLQLDRADFYEKELSFQVSCSYGPGRYDTDYEQQGIDYPLAHVRWTEQRNIAAVVELMAAGKIDPTCLITSRVPHDDAEQAYDLLASDPSQLAIVLEYPQSSLASESRVVHSPNTVRPATGTAVVGIIGAGQFAKGTLLPALSRTNARLKTIASAGGVNAATLANKFGFGSATTDYETILDDDEINTVIIATRHHLHAELAAAALKAGKHVFVEKPLAIDRAGLQLVQTADGFATDQQLLVGFNRRFAPLSATMRDLLARRTQPASAIVTVNAGPIPADHWIHDPSIGGGRIIGEACHWIDLLCFLFASEVTTVHASQIESSLTQDQATITMAFADGSIGTVHYFTNGHRSFPKERIEVFSEGCVLTLDNFRRLTGQGWPNFRRQSHFRQNKGHQAELQQFIRSITAGGLPLIPPDELWNVSEATFAAVESLRTGDIMHLDR